MEKLIKLLDEYRKQNPREFFGDDGSLVVLTGKDFIELNRLIIISKEYGFIQWLVDNDKIDKEFEDYKMLGDIFDSGYRFNDNYMEERLLCYLALSKEPISFLISILK